MALLDENDILFAQKALLLMPDLTEAAKRVACAILDHFNKRTGQCDPGIERLTKMLGLNRATVLRATDALCERGVFEKDSHGGKSHRASYRPQWHRFREFVADWDARMKVGAAPGELDSAAQVPETKVAKLRRSRSQDCDVKGRTAATQTLRSNPSNKPIEAEQVETQAKNAPLPPMQKRVQGLSKMNRQTGQKHLLLPMQGGRQVSHGEAAREAALQRWSRDIKSLGEATYGAVVEWLNIDRIETATEAELQRKGGGREFIAASMLDERLHVHG